MGKRISVSVRSRTMAGPSTVFALLADGATWPGWTPISSFRLESEGRDGGESEGAIREFSTRGVRSREQLLAVVPDRTLSYSALSGLPVRDHRAEVELTPDDGGTTITWSESFEASVPGTGHLLGALLRRFLQRCADGLAAHAAGQAPT